MKLLGDLSRQRVASIFFFSISIFRSPPAAEIRGKI